MELQISMASAPTFHKEKSTPMVMEDILMIQAHLKAHIGNQPFGLLNKLKNDIRVETKTSPIPNQLCCIIPKLRNYLKKIFPSDHITNYTFNIAVCNNYLILI